MTQHYPPQPPKPYELRRANALRRIRQWRPLTMQRCGKKRYRPDLVIHFDQLEKGIMHKVGESKDGVMWVGWNTREDE